MRRGHCIEQQAHLSGKHHDEFKRLHSLVLRSVTLSHVAPKLHELFVFHRRMLVTICDPGAQNLGIFIGTANNTLYGSKL